MAVTPFTSACDLNHILLGRFLSLCSPGLCLPPNAMQLHRG